MGLFRLLGSDIRDCRTGQVVGRGVVVAWRGKVHLLGVAPAVVPVPLRQERVTYWRQEIGFTCHGPVDYPDRRQGRATREAPDKTLLVLLDHRDAVAVGENLALWRHAGFGPERILLAYGGRPETFATLPVENKILLEDPRLRTRDAQRERQSYRELLVKTTAWLQGRPFTHVLFHEFDHLPLVSDLEDRLLERMHHEGAAVLGYHVGRIDGSTNPHWLNCVEETWPCEEALLMIGTGHFWTREAWEAVTADPSLASWYLELDLPSTAHRQGFRVRSMAEQEPFVRTGAEFLPALEEAIDRGAWTYHPVKDPALFAKVAKHLEKKTAPPEKPEAR